MWNDVWEIACELPVWSIQSASVPILRQISQICLVSTGALLFEDVQLFGAI